MGYCDLLERAPICQANSGGSVKHKTGDATEPSTAGNKIIAQVVNSYGAMGAGFGKSISKKFPKAKRAVEEWKTDTIRFQLGKSQLIKVDQELYILQMLAQKGIFKRNNEIPLQYDSLHQCLVDLRENALKYDASVHMPRIGAGQAKGDWGVISKMIEKELSEYGIEVIIYTLPKKQSNAVVRNHVLSDFIMY